jgi:phage anti-repressor protein
LDTNKAQEALQMARELAQQTKSATDATDLHNAFFGIGGKFSELFPTRAEREAFAKTPEYQEIVRLRAALPQREKAAF